MSVKVRIGAAGLIAVIAGLSLFGWLATPAGAEIAVHWDASGAADRYGGKAEAFLVSPGIAVLLSLLLLAAPHIDPRGRNLARSAAVLNTVWIGTLAVLAAAQAGITLTAIGVFTADGGAIPLLVGLSACALIAVLGNVLGKARPNWFVGVRTPWTLSSDRSWDAAHRWAGRGFVASGLLGGAAILLAPIEAGFAVFTVAVLVTAAGAVVLSYFVWRSDPDRETFNEPG